MTTETEKYNGWTNYATWRVNLEILDEYLNSESHPELNRMTESELSQHLKDYTEEIVTGDSDVPSLARDYALSFLSDVDWYEIAEDYIADREAENA